MLLFVKNEGWNQGPREVELKATGDFSLALKWNGVSLDFETDLDQ